MEPKKGISSWTMSMNSEQSCSKVPFFRSKTLYKKNLDRANSGDLSTMLGPNNKSFRGFHPWIPLRDFRVIGWLAR